MSSTLKRRRLQSDLEEPICDDDLERDEHVSEPEPRTLTVQPLLPSLPKVPGREYINVKSRIAAYWVHFREYTEKGKRRAECLYCVDKNFASDGTKNGSKNIRNHWLACPANPDAPINKSKGKQTELVFERGVNEGEGKLKGWTLNLNEVREAVVYMIVIDELPFRFVEKPGFKRLMSVTCPSFTIPSRVTITRDCYKLYSNEKAKLKELLNVSSQRVSFTTDTWTSIQKVNYMCVTAHYIDNDWILHKKIISFCPIYSHKGKAIASLLDSCFESWGLDDKVFTLTVDNASSNDTACLELKKILQKKQNTIGKGNYMHMRCVAHIINLIVWDGLKKNKKSIDKVRYAVKFVKSSPARLKFFKDVAKNYTDCERSLSLSLDVPTRWNATYLMLDVAFIYKDAFRDVNVPVNPIGDELGPDLDDVDEFGNPIECEVEHSGAPSDHDWAVVESLLVFLKEFKVLTDQVSGSLYVTSNSSFFFIARALHQLKKWADSDDNDFRVMSLAMKQKFDKYWGDVEKMNVLIYMGAILDPHVKLGGLEYAFTKLYGAPKSEQLTRQVYKKANDLFDEYRRLYASSTMQESTIDLDDNAGYDDSLDFKKAIERQVRMSQLEGGYAKSEFDRYLNELLGSTERDCEVMVWWKLNCHRYPVLAHMARDILAVPISTVASESTFSAGRRHLSPFRSSLTPKIVEALLCAQDWIRPRNDRGLDMEEKLDELEKLEKDLANITILDQEAA